MAFGGGARMSKTLIRGVTFILMDSEIGELMGSEAHTDAVA